MIRRISTLLLYAITAFVALWVSLSVWYWLATYGVMGRIAAAMILGVSLVLSVQVSLFGRKVYYRRDRM